MLAGTSKKYQKNLQYFINIKAKFCKNIFLFNKQCIFVILTVNIKFIVFYNLEKNESLPVWSDVLFFSKWYIDKYISGDKTHLIKHFSLKKH